MSEDTHIAAATELEDTLVDHYPTLAPLHLLPVLAFETTFGIVSFPSPRILNRISSDRPTAAARATLAFFTLGLPSGLRPLQVCRMLGR